MVQSVLPATLQVRGDLIRTLEKLIKRKNKFDAILIETTGLADPTPVILTFYVEEAISSALRLDAVLTVVRSVHSCLASFFCGLLSLPTITLAGRCQA